MLRTIIRTWALIGGLILVALMLMMAASAASNLIFDKPFEGDYEMMKHFIAIAIFCFLPYCQLTGANVTVDIFTESMSERAKSAMLAFSSLFAIVFAAVLLRRCPRLGRLHPLPRDDGGTPHTCCGPRFLPPLSRSRFSSSPP